MGYIAISTISMAISTISNPVSKNLCTAKKIADLKNKADYFSTNKKQ